MDLRQLLTALNQKQVSADANPVVTGLTHDSRCVRPGFVFVCICGYCLDGHDYIKDALDRGAVAIVAEKGCQMPASPVWIKVPNSREALALLATEFYQHPSRKMRVIGITGTNGKTTTSYLVASILEAAGFSVGLTNTLICRIRGKETASVRTTPESVDLQRSLRQMVDLGCQYAVIEVSSHSLALNRVLGCEFDVGVLTNVTSDHLDFHHNFSEYLRVKQSLFSEYAPKTAVLNLDDPTFSTISQNTTAAIFSYGLQSEALVRAERIILSPSGTTFEVCTPDERTKINTPLCGLHNVSNILAAISVGLAEGIDPRQIKKGVEKVSAVAGRFETIDCGQNFWVVVDFAHTPDALKNLLQTARGLRPRQIITVFGCGGDRDQSKRFPMGRLAAELSDRIIITNDNPRGEAPLSIARQIEKGVHSVADGPKRCELILERYQAIKKALIRAKAGDMVLIAGKGHEQYQIIGSQRIRFDDRQVASQIISNLKSACSAPKDLTASDILLATHGHLDKGSPRASFCSVSINSRTIKPGEIFWTLPGDRFDGHDFVNEAIAKEAGGAVVGPEFIPPAFWPQKLPLIRVQDRLLALQKTAHYLRQQFPVPLVAVTGTNGKTTTKEMIASIMSCYIRGGRKVLKTKGNYNNLIGLPLTLCGLSDEVDMAVLELGMNAFGEIRQLTKICQPDIGLVTNIGPAHLEFFGSLEKIAQAKKELFEEMKPGGIAIVNNDDPYGRDLANHAHGGRIITFGIREEADLRGEKIHLCETKTAFTLNLDGKKLCLNLPLVGQMNVYNALAAASVAWALNIPLPIIQEGLKRIILPPMRMMRLTGWNGSIIINDAYNANPVSMRLAIDTLAQVKGEGKKILVLGDMLELGAQTERFHRQMGQLIASYPIDFLFTCGRLAQWIAKEAIINGMKKDSVFIELNHKNIAETLKPLLAEGDRVLVKGSRTAGMERVVNMLMDE